MAACPTCSREMRFKVSCDQRPGAIPHGSERIWATIGSTPNGPCGDCGSPVGGIHHLCCCKEECEHGGQLITCRACAPELQRRMGLA